MKKTTITKPHRWTKPKVVKFFEALAAGRPEPKTELAYENAFQLLVAVVLSAQSTDVGVNRATAGLFKLVKTPEAMVKLGLKKLVGHVRTIGLFNTKAKNVLALSEMLVRLHGSEVPREREALEALPGVGRKTANVVLNVIWGEETCAVDTHIFRVANRTGLAPGKTPLAVETGLMAIIPQPYRRDAHHWLILHGRYICVARTPKCDECPVKPLCPWPKQQNHAKDVIELHAKVTLKATKLSKK